MSVGFESAAHPQFRRGRRGAPVPPRGRAGRPVATGFERAIARARGIPRRCLAQPHHAQRASHRRGREIPGARAQYPGRSGIRGAGSARPRLAAGAAACRWRRSRRWPRGCCRKWWPAFMQRFPGIDVQMIELSSEDVERCVASGNADIGIGPAPERNSELSFSFLLRDRFVGVVPKTSKLAPAKAGAAGNAVRLSADRHRSPAPASGRRWNAPTGSTDARCG